MRTHSLSRIEFVPLFLSPLIIVRRTNPRVTASCCAAWHDFLQRGRAPPRPRLRARVHRLATSSSCRSGWCGTSAPPPASRRGRALHALSSVVSQRCIACGLSLQVLAAWRLAVVAHHRCVRYMVEPVCALRRIHESRVGMSVQVRRRCLHTLRALRCAHRPIVGAPRSSLLEVSPRSSRPRERFAPARSLLRTHAGALAPPAAPPSRHLLARLCDLLRPEGPRAAAGASLLRAPQRIAQCLLLLFSERLCAASTLL
jgi:hypothetical protein